MSIPFTVETTGRTVMVCENTLRLVAGGPEANDILGKYVGVHVSAPHDVPLWGGKIVYAAVELVAAGVVLE